MPKYYVDILTKSGKDVFYYVISDKDLYKLFRQRMSRTEDTLIGLKSANGGKIIIDCADISAVVIRTEKNAVSNIQGSEDCKKE